MSAPDLAPGTPGWNILLTLRRAPCDARGLPGTGAAKTRTLADLAAAGLVTRNLAPGQSAARPRYKYAITTAGFARLRGWG